MSEKREYTTKARAIFDPNGKRIAMGKTNTDAAEIADNLNFAISGRRLSMEPSAISEHLDGEVELTDEEAEKVSAIVFDSDIIYGAFHDSIMLAVEEVVNP